MRHIVILWGFLLIVGCSGDQAPKGPTLIVCTTGIIGDAVKNMVGPDCEVRVLMGPGTDPHIFKPSKESLDLLTRADAIVANGFHLEGRMHDILEKLSRSRTVIFAGDGIAPSELLYADENHNTPDPHLWFDVSLWRKSCAHLAQSLNENLPDCYNESSANEYLNMLDQLHGKVSAELESIPQEQRVLITAHDAFGYFGRAYGVEVLALQGISTVSEYGVRDVSRMVDLITERRIKAIFTESSISPRSMEAVMAGCEERGFALKQGGTLYSDALGPEGSGADTYAGMVNHNLITIKTALE
jgi:manganese/zinc/iron transport system substrate-binding protein